MIVVDDVNQSIGDGAFDGRKESKKRLTYYEAVRNISFMTTEGQQSKWAFPSFNETLKGKKNLRDQAASLLYNANPSAAVIKS